MYFFRIINRLSYLFRTLSEPMSSVGELTYNGGSTFRRASLAPVNKIVDNPGMNVVINRRRRTIHILSTGRRQVHWDFLQSRRTG